MVHLQKLAVGIRDIAHLREVQAARAKANPPLRHHTRTSPKRTAEITDGGSIYWVIAGAMIVRQRILGFQPGAWDDGSPATAILLDPALVPVAARLVRPFQGWRYLPAADAPPDLSADAPPDGAAEMPPALRRELRSLGLL